MNQYHLLQQVISFKHQLFLLYKNMVESDGGSIINEIKTKRLINWMWDRQIRYGVVTAPWAGVKLDSNGDVEKAYSLLPYSTGVYFHPSQTTAGFRPEQVGETWIFDGVDDFLSVDIEDHPDALTLFSRGQNTASQTGQMVGLVDGSPNSSGGRIRILKVTSCRFQISTGSASLQIIGSSDMSNSMIGTYENSNAIFYIDGSEFDTASITLNPIGTTVLSIGRREDGIQYLDDVVDAATGIFLTALTPQEVAEFNLLM